VLLLLRLQAQGLPLTMLLASQRRLLQEWLARRRRLQAPPSLRRTPRLQLLLQRRCRRPRCCPLPCT
jgi:hypothetical protein